jgi:hypothetical protein
MRNHLSVDKPCINDDRKEVMVEKFSVCERGKNFINRKLSCTVITV